MQRRIARLPVEVLEGEGAKFTSPMVLVHGLWDEVAVWRPFMGYLAHRGWRCFAVDWRRAAESPRPGTFAALADDLRDACVALEAPPVVVGHDLGALLALHAAAVARAVAALSPLPLPALHRAGPAHLARAGTVLDRLRGRPLTAPAVHSAFASAGGEAVRESPSLLDELRRMPVLPDPVPAGTPALLLCGDADPITPLEAAQRLAAHAHAELRVVPGATHALHHEPGWDRRVSDLHRWLIQSLGEPLLARLEESEEDSEAED